MATKGMAKRLLAVDRRKDQESNKSDKEVIQNFMKSNVAGTRRIASRIKKGEFNDPNAALSRKFSLSVKRNRDIGPAETMSGRR